MTRAGERLRILGIDSGSRTCGRADTPGEPRRSWASSLRSGTRPPCWWTPPPSPISGPWLPPVELLALAGGALEAISRSGFDVVILSGEPAATAVLTSVRRLMPGALVVLDAFELGFVREGRRNRFEGEGAARALALDLKLRELSLAQSVEVTWTSSRADAGWVTAAVSGLMVDVVPPVCDAIEDRPGFHDRAGVVVVGDPIEPSRRDAETFFAREILPRLEHRCPALACHTVRLHARPNRADPAPDPGRQLDRARVLVGAPFRFSTASPSRWSGPRARATRGPHDPAGAEGLDPSR